MAESDSGQERTEEPTGKRLQESRDKGQVARSRELNTLAVVMVAAVGLLILGPAMVQKLMNKPGWLTTLWLLFQQVNGQPRIPALRPPRPNALV